MGHFRIFFRTSALFLAMVGFGMATAHMEDIPADSPKIQYFGRWAPEGGVYRCGYGATYIKAKFTGRSLKADLGGSSEVWWRVSIDGGEFRRFKAQGRDTLLAENLSPGEHRVLLVRSTEGNAGISEFRGFRLEEGGSLAEPEEGKNRRLEFVGDSITAGAMNDGTWVDNYFDVEDNDMSYGPQLARMLDADYSVIAKSGQGVVYNYAEEWPAMGVHACDSYAWTFFSDTFDPGNQRWEAARFPVDGVLISIGTNDFSGGGPVPTEEEFKEGYRHLISVVRGMNPDSAIICIDPFSMALKPEVREWTGEVAEEMSAGGDGRLYYISIDEEGPLFVAADFADGVTHPTKEGSTKAAVYLRDRVARILGWQ